MEMLRLVDLRVRMAQNNISFNSILIPKTRHNVLRLYWSVFESCHDVEFCYTMVHEFSRSERRVDRYLTCNGG